MAVTHLVMTAMLDSKPSTRAAAPTSSDTYRRNIGEVTPPARTLLEPGHEAEWAELNREKRDYHHRTARALTPSERIAEGQKLSQQAVSLLAASIRGGHAPRRAFWS